MKITKAELKEIIREEAYRFKKKLQLESELAEIEAQLNEVEAVGTREIPGGGGHGYGKEFENLKAKDGSATHTIKEEEVEFEEEGGEGVDLTAEDTALEEMLAEIMAEDDYATETVEECGTMEEDNFEEEEYQGNMEEMISEGEVKKVKGLISEQVRMKRLAGVISESEERMLQEMDWMSELLGSDSYMEMGKGILTMLGTFSIGGLLYFTQWLKSMKDKGVKPTKEEIEAQAKIAKSK